MIVWSGNNGCHVSQEDVCNLWVALCPSFPDSYGILRLPEQAVSSQIVRALCRVVRFLLRIHFRLADHSLLRAPLGQRC